MKKYELLKNDTITDEGRTLYRIRALKDLGWICAGELGGHIESEKNLSQDGLCWVFENAKVVGNAVVEDNAWVTGNARVAGNATVIGSVKVADDTVVIGNALVAGNARVIGSAKVAGDAIVTGNAKVGNQAYIVDTRDLYSQGPIGSRNDYVTFYQTKDQGIWVCAGCFNGSMEEFLTAVKEKHGSSSYAKEYFRAAETAQIQIGGKA